MDGMDSVVTAMTTAVTSIGDKAMSAIGSVLPGALIIAGAVIVVSIGLKVFKKFAK